MRQCSLLIRMETICVKNTNTIKVLENIHLVKCWLSALALSASCLLLFVPNLTKKAKRCCFRYRNCSSGQGDESSELYELKNTNERLAWASWWRRKYQPKQADSYKALTRGKHSGENSGGCQNKALRCWKESPRSFVIEFFSYWACLAQSGLVSIWV